MRLLGKVAVVTGAASGIGKEIARAYRREGAKVVIADLNQDEADTVAAELGATMRSALRWTSRARQGSRPAWPRRSPSSAVSTCW